MRGFVCPVSTPTIKHREWCVCQAMMVCRGGRGGSGDGGWTATTTNRKRGCTCVQTQTVLMSTPRNMPHRHTLTLLCTQHTHTDLHTHTHTHTHTPTHTHSPSECAVGVSGAARRLSVLRGVWRRAAWASPRCVCSAYRSQGGQEGQEGSGGVAALICRADRLGATRAGSKHSATRCCALVSSRSESGTARRVTADGPPRGGPLSQVTGHSTELALEREQQKHIHNMFHSS